MGFTYRVIIYRCINDTGHLRIKIYVINGYDKTYLQQKKFMISSEEYNSESMIMNPASIIYDKNKEFKFKVFMMSASSCVNIRIVKLM